MSASPSLYLSLSLSLPNRSWSTPALEFLFLIDVGKWRAWGSLVGGPCWPHGGDPGPENVLTDDRPLSLPSMSLSLAHLVPDYQEDIFTGIIIELPGSLSGLDQKGIVGKLQAGRSASAGANQIFFLFLFPSFSL